MEAWVMLLHEAVGNVVEVKLVNGKVYRGKLVSCEKNSNFYLQNVSVTAEDEKASHLDHTSFTGGQVMFVDIPEMPEISEIIRYIAKFKQQHRGPSENMILVKCDNNQIVKLKRTVAVQMNLLKDLMDTNIEENPIYRLPGVTVETLCMVINCCGKNIQPSSFQKDFDVQLFNLIQAAHHFKFKSLMDSACEALKEKVKKLNEKLALEKKLKALLSPSQEHLRRSHPLEAEVPVVVRVKISNMLRSHGEETFIRQLDLEDVHCSPFVANELFFLDKKSEIVACVDNVLTDFSPTLMTRDSMEDSYYQLENPLKRLENLINGEPRLANHLSANDAHSLVQIIDNIEFILIKCGCISILSHAPFDKWSDVIEGEALPLFVRLMGDDYSPLASEVLIALTRLAYTYPDRIQVILEKGALEAAHKSCCKNVDGYHFINSLAKFLVAVCRGVKLSRDEFSDTEVNTILNISEVLFKQYLVTNFHIVCTCYALSYLSYGRSVPIETAELKHLTTLFTDADILVAGSAFGVVANIARWGSENQIKLLAKDPKLVQGLGSKWLGCKLKMFQKGACQIISNMAAQCKTFRENMHSSLIDPLLKLLEKDGNESDVRMEEDEFDVKMEAAWSLFNSSDAYDVDMIDKYNNDNLMAAAVLHLKNKSSYTTLMSVARPCNP